MTAASSILSVRLTADERTLLAQAADNGSTSLSDFVRRKAVEAAEIEILSRTVVTIPAKDWERFEAWAREPAKDVPALRKLAASRPAWED